MMAGRSVWLHVGVLGVASALALRSWTTDAAQQPGEAGVELWGGSAAQVKSVYFETKDRKVRIEPRTDERGVYYVGTVDSAKRRPSKPAVAAAGAGAGGATGVGGAAVGGESSSSAGTSAESADAPTEWKSEIFVATQDVQTLVASMAPLRAKRSLGKLDAGHAADFGLDKADGTLTVVIGDKTHTLVLGGEAPGGIDTYVKVGEDAYAVDGTIDRHLRNAGTRLMQSEFHAFEDQDVHHARITAGSESRELLRDHRQRFTWTRMDKPDERDETASNWMTKIRRLAALKYVETPDPPITPADLVFTIEYFDKNSANIGTLEVVRGPKEEDKPTYYARSELSRWYTVVVNSTAEQAEQDLASVLNQ